MILEGFAAARRVVEARAHAGYVVVEGAEAQGDRRVRVDRADRLAVDQVLRVVAQAGIFHVVVVAVAGLNGQDVRR